MAQRHDLLRPAYAVVVLLLVLQFVQVPFLGGGDRAAKALLFAASVLFWFWSRLGWRRFSLPRGWRLILAVACLPLLSALSSRDGYNSLLFAAGLFVALLFAALVADMARRSPELLPMAVDGLLVAGVFTACFGLYEFVHFQWLGPSRTMLLPYLWPPDLGPRVVGHYGQANHFALFLVVVLLGFCYRYLHRPQPDFAALRWRSLRFVPVAMVCCTLFLTQSKAGLLAAGMLLLGMAWLVVRGRYLHGEPAKRWEFWRLLLCLVWGLLLSKGLAWLTPPPEIGGALFSNPAVGKSLGQVLAATSSGDIRLFFWMSALLIAGGSPWLGVGLDGFKFHLPAAGPEAQELLGFLPYEAMSFSHWAHSELLQLLCETGVFVFLAVLYGLWRYGRSLWGVLRGPERPPVAESLYAHLFVFPFLLQALLSWCLRNPPLLALFAFFIGLLASRYRGDSVLLSAGSCRSMRLAVLAALLTVGLLLHQQIKMGQLQSMIKASPASLETFAAFEELAANPYTRYDVLDGALPVLLRSSFIGRDLEASRRLLPHVEAFAQNRGNLVDWTRLGLLYYEVGNRKKSRQAMRLALEQRPDFEAGWRFLHYLNVEEASRRTGRPIQAFYPEDPGVELVFERYFYGRDRI